MDVEVYFVSFENIQLETSLDKPSSIVSSRLNVGC